MTKFELTITGTFECADSHEAFNLSEEFAKALDALGVTVEDADCDEVDYDLPDERVVEMFEEGILPSVVAQFGPNDVTAKREAFNNYTDSLCKEGRITEYQYANIDNPY